MKRLAVILGLAACLWAQPRPGKTPSGAGSARPDPSAEEADLGRALSEAGNSPVEFIRVLEAHLARYPESKRRDDVERALVKAAMEVKDNRRIALYGERVLARDSADLQLLDRVARALLATGGADGAKRALQYARKSGELVAGMRSQKPPGRMGKGRWNEEVDRAMARALALEARATGALGRHDEAATIATRSFESFPTAEAAREAARELAAAGKPGQAIEWFAMAFAIPDARATDAERAEDRALLGGLYRQAKGSEAGLGDIVLQAYDRASALLAERRLRLSASDPNANLTHIMDFTLSGLNGDKLELRKLRGKTLVFDFWATWCGPCRAQHPLYEEVKKRFQNRPEVVFLSVSTDEERSNVEPFLQDLNWSKKVYFEDGLSRTLEISSIPTTIIVDRRGEVFSRLNGFVPDRFVDMLTERIEEALKN
jgi:thiol-disulfide isomerase/thioredoxin